MPAERIQKILAQVGLASRRKAEELISLGFVTVNGKIAKLGDKAELGKDAIKVHGKLLLQNQVQGLTYIAFYKPKGVICAVSDPEGRATLTEFMDKLKLKARVVPAGRLDFNSEGLVLLTNDGDFIEKLQKRDDILRVYAVKVKGHVDEEMITRLGRGAWIGFDRKRYFKPHAVHMKQELAQKTVIEVVVKGGGAYDLKGYFELKGFLVERMIRTAIGHITLRAAHPGECRFLKQSQAFALLERPELAEKKLADEKAELKMITRRPKETEKKPKITPVTPVKKRSSKPRD